MSADWNRGPLTRGELQAFFDAALFKVTYR
jgi:hypothetical protein